MLSQVNDYAAVNARTRAMYARMLTTEDWNQLHESRDCTRIIQVLRETVYGPYLNNVDEKLLHPRRVEFEIKKHLSNSFDILTRLVPKRARNFFYQYYRVHEVDNLKAILRGLQIGQTWDQVRYLLFPCPSHSSFSSQVVSETASIEAAVDLLKGTPYYSTLSHAMERYTSEKSLFPLEVALDLDYWRKLWQEVNGLSGEDRRVALKICGTSLDHINLLWALRYRVFHGLSEEEIINYTLPFGMKVHDIDIQEIASGANILQVVNRIYPDVPSLAEMMRDPAEGLSAFELALQRDLIEVCKNTFTGNPFHLGIPLAYLTLLEMEIQDLIVLIEARAMDIPYERYQSYLLFKFDNAFIKNPIG